MSGSTILSSAVQATPDRVMIRKYSQHKQNICFTLQIVVYLIYAAIYTADTAELIRKSNSCLLCVEREITVELGKKVIKKVPLM